MKLPLTAEEEGEPSKCLVFLPFFNAQSGKLCHSQDELR